VLKIPFKRIMVVVVMVDICRARIFIRSLARYAAPAATGLKLISLVPISIVIKVLHCFGSLEFCSFLLSDQHVIDVLFGEVHDGFHVPLKEVIREGIGYLFNFGKGRHLQEFLLSLEVLNLFLQLLFLRVDEAINDDSEDETHQEELSDDDHHQAVEGSEPGEVSIHQIAQLLVPSV